MLISKSKSLGCFNVNSSTALGLISSSLLKCTMGNWRHHVWCPPTLSTRFVMFSLQLYRVTSYSKLKKKILLRIGSCARWGLHVESHPCNGLGIASCFELIGVYLQHYSSCACVGLCSMLKHDNSIVGMWGANWQHVMMLWLEEMLLKFLPNSWWSQRWLLARCHCLCSIATPWHFPYLSHI